MGHIVAGVIAYHVLCGLCSDDRLIRWAFWTNTCRSIGMTRSCSPLYKRLAATSAPLFVRAFLRTRAPTAPAGATLGSVMCDLTLTNACVTRNS